jgi:hypothetical protein
MNILFFTKGQGTSISVDRLEKSHNFTKFYTISYHLVKMSENSAR